MYNYIQLGCVYRVLYVQRRIHLKFEINPSKRACENGTISLIFSLKKYLKPLLRTSGWKHGSERKNHRFSVVCLYTLEWILFRYMISLGEYRVLLKQWLMAKTSRTCPLHYLEAFLQASSRKKCSWKEEIIDYPFSVFINWSERCFVMGPSRNSSPWTTEFSTPSPQFTLVHFSVRPPPPSSLFFTFWKSRNT